MFQHIILVCSTQYTSDKKLLSLGPKIMTLVYDNPAYDAATM